MRWGNIIMGALGLALLQGIVSGKGAQNVGGFVGNAGKAVAWFVDPTVPAFKNTTTPSTSSAPNAVASQPVPGAVPATFANLNPTFAGESPQTVAQGGAV